MDPVRKLEPRPPHGRHLGRPPGKADASGSAAVLKHGQRSLVHETHVEVYHVALGGFCQGLSNPRPPERNASNFFCRFPRSMARKLQRTDRHETRVLRMRGGGRNDSNRNAAAVRCRICPLPPFGILPLLAPPPPPSSSICYAYARARVLFSDLPNKGAPAFRAPTQQGLLPNRDGKQSEKLR